MRPVTSCLNPPRFARRLLALLLLACAAVLPLSAQDDDLPFAAPDPDLDLSQRITDSTGDLTLGFPQDWDLNVDEGQVTYTTAGVTPNVEAADVPDGEMLGLIFTPNVLTEAGGFVVDGPDEVVAQLSEAVTFISVDGVVTAGPVAVFTFNGLTAAYRTGTVSIDGAKLNYGVMALEIAPGAYVAALYFAQTASLDAFDPVILAVMAGAEYQSTSAAAPARAS